ncbi:transposase [Bacteroides fragilis]|nr:transposase [Bacteroides fragilis]MCE8810304.1 transposase [Bacteroides fragilis]MCE8819590.1 transposase [Bacteroides fragilis]MCE9112015.1 transposase [Bacteroides fragilis]
MEDIEGLISIYNKLMLRKRNIIESLNDALKNIHHLYTFATVAYIIFR